MRNDVTISDLPLADLADALDRIEWAALGLEVSAMLIELGVEQRHAARLVACLGGQASFRDCPGLNPRARVEP